MKNIISILKIIIIVFIFVSCKKEGCTDVNALNYSPKAKSKPSLCQYPTDAPYVNYPVLVTGTFNFIDDDSIVQYKGISNYFDLDNQRVPDVFGYCPSDGSQMYLYSAQFEKEKQRYDVSLALENDMYDLSLYGNYDLSYNNQYVDFNLAVVGIKNGVWDFDAHFPFPNHQNYYKDLNTPIDSIEGNISINFREPEPGEQYTDFSGVIDAVLYYDEEIIYDENNQAVVIYHKKLIVNLDCNGKIEVF